MTGRERLARQVALMVSSGPDSDADEELRAQYLDTIGCAVAGADEKTVATVRAITPSWSDGVTLVNGGRSDPVSAAFHNAVSSHILDFDDTHSNSLVHTSAVVVPVLSAVAESSGATYGAMLDAYRLGIRSTGFFEALGPALNGAGVHATAVIGSIAAAAAAGWLLTGNVEGSSDAAHLAAGMSVGLCANFGRDAKSLQVGNAAAVATRAAQLAARGMTAGETIFGPSGVFAKTLGRTAEETVRWDDPCEDALRVLDIKPYPCCYLIRPAADLARAAHTNSVTADPASTEQVSVEIGPLAAELADQDPVLDNANSLKFSLRYCVAVTLLTGNVTVGAIRNPHEQVDVTMLNSLLSRMQVRIDPDLPPTHSRLTVERGGASEASATQRAAEKISVGDVLAKFGENSEALDTAAVVAAVMKDGADAPFVSHWGR